MAETQRKSNDIVLKLPGKKIPTLLASVSTTTKTSIRQELKITATLLNAGGADINEASQSVSTVYRQQKVSVTAKAGDMRNKFMTSFSLFTGITKSSN